MKNQEIEAQYKEIKLNYLGVFNAQGTSFWLPPESASDDAEKCRRLVPQFACYCRCSVVCCCCCFRNQKKNTRQPAADWTDEDWRADDGEGSRWRNEAHGDDEKKKTRNRRYKEWRSKERKEKKNHAGEKQNVGEKMLLSSLHFINFFKQ